MQALLQGRRRPSPWQWVRGAIDDKKRELVGVDRGVAAAYRGLEAFEEGRVAEARVPAGPV